MSEYIVVKHKIPKMSIILFDAKYVDGYAVVIKDGKTHKHLKKIRDAIASEHSLTALTKLPSVYKESVIKDIWGQKVYREYQEAKKEQNKPKCLKDREQMPNCKAMTADGKPCTTKALKDFEYCHHHITEDERIGPEIEKMGMRPKKDKKEVIDKLIKKIREGNK